MRGDYGSEKPLPHHHHWREEGESQYSAYTEGNKIEHEVVECVKLPGNDYRSLAKEHPPSNERPPPTFGPISCIG